MLFQCLHCGGGKGLLSFPVQRRGKACPQQLYRPVQLLRGAALQRHQCFRAPGAAVHRALPSVRQGFHSLLHGLLRRTEQPQHAARRALFFFCHDASPLRPQGPPLLCPQGLVQGGQGGWVMLRALGQHLRTGRGLALCQPQRQF